MHVIFYGDKYSNESGGEIARYYDELTGEPLTSYDLEVAMTEGDVVHIRPATVFDCDKMEALLAIVNARRAARKTEVESALAQIEAAIDSILKWPEQKQELDNQEGKHAH